MHWGGGGGRRLYWKSVSLIFFSYGQLAYEMVITNDENKKRAYFFPIFIPLASIKGVNFVFQCNSTVQISKSHQKQNVQSKKHIEIILCRQQNITTSKLFLNILTSKLFLFIVIKISFCKYIIQLPNSKHASLFLYSRNLNLIQSNLILAILLDTCGYQTFIPDLQETDI